MQVTVGHFADCKDRERKCVHARRGRAQAAAPLEVASNFEGGRERCIGAETRSWEQAEGFAKEYPDSFDLAGMHPQQLASVAAS
jgi:hypothetical protein